ncbi:hypothetical protein VitviT2T_021108 [Vitis vinifera]|uniref:Major facilitator superfamily (MFS) profile domain-containing protein n=1 Tax=Vitis vinifera TaxID=29760 RepID=A0ABY9D604_VITVI|nr:hypothetical protein VitviT2T_021108 [Vitis vinifera]
MERGNMDEGLTTSSLLLAEKEVRDGSFNCSFIWGYSSPVEHELMDDLGLSLAEYSVFVSIWAFGGIIASLMTGTAIDFIGRRGTMLFADISCIIGWLLIALAKMYPINIKGSAGGLVSLANWFFSVVVTYTFNYMFEWSSPGTFFFYSLISAATVLFTAKLIPETKGRTLEEIQASMTKFLE